jgi:DNA-binding response OmpR family regulator
MVAWLGVGFDLTIVTTFEAAKAQLSLKPELVIADVKLGAYNGLQVAARARMMGTATIVTGPADAVLRRDALQFGAVYLESGLCESPLVATVRRLLGMEPEPCPRPEPAQDRTDWQAWSEPDYQPKSSAVH